MPSQEARYRQEAGASSEQTPVDGSLNPRHKSVPAVPSPVYPSIDFSPVTKISTRPSCAETYPGSGGVGGGRYGELHCVARRQVHPRYACLHRWWRALSRPHGLGLSRCEGCRRWQGEEDATRADCCDREQAPNLRTPPASAGGFTSRRPWTVSSSLDGALHHRCSQQWPSMAKHRPRNGHFQPTFGGFCPGSSSGVL